ncbi:MAG: Cna B domain protein [Ignavibacteria bacterium]|nr:MAG: Cna B domain protein [Ignavibacteria bacterium]KAF0160703.1 MAG: Cna B domain protein [Ignavibacteria bacterium]
MKKIYISASAIFFFFALTNLIAQSALATWPLTSNQNPNTPSGNIQASAQTIGAGSGTYILSIFNPYVANGQRLWTGNQGTGWIAGLPDYTRYIQFDASPTSGNNFTVQNVSFQYSDNPLGTDFNIIKAEVWYSTNDWNSKTQLHTSPLNYLNTSVQTFSKSLNVQVLNGQTFSVRIYPYTLNGGLAMTPSFATHRNVHIEGVTSPAVTTGSICGMKFNDLNGNGRKDSGEQGLSGVTINLSMGAVNRTVTTGADGSYCFNDLPAGTYILSESPISGWSQTYPTNPSTHTVVLAAGQNVLNVDFGNNKKLGSISGIKFNDLNGTGDQQVPAEAGLPNWIINLTGPVTLSATTDANGYYQFNNLPAGTYTITETNQSGWQQIYPSSPGSYVVILAEGETIVGKNFANRQILSSICGMKFNDLNGNRINDNEPGLSGWVIELKYNGPNGVVTLRDTTDSRGNYCFNNLPFGTYTLTEVNKSGWTQTTPASPGSYTVIINQEVNLIGKDFGNKEVVNPNCTDFENNSLGGWQANNISTSFHQNGSNTYIQTTDKAGVSTFFTTSAPFVGNWTSLFANGCGSLCFDINFIYGGDVYNGVTPPQTLTPYIALEGAGFKASFVANQSVSVGGGWRTYCAPLSFLNSDGTLPSNSDGYWIMTAGTASDWNTLLTNVTKVRLLADPTSFQGEKIGYDNICLKNTGDCNSPSRTGSICGFKILDKNGDGIRDSNEDVIPYWEITLTNGTISRTTTTNANGQYCFENLPAGTYTVSEEQRTGYRQVFPPTPGVHTITLLPGENKTNINFSNVEDISIRLGSICGIKYHDKNGNGKQDLPDDIGLPGWTFQLTGASNQTVVTDLNGNFCFTNLKAGSYTIKEVIQDGWEPTFPNNTGIINVTLAEGQNLEGIFFGNKEKLGSICGFKYNDLNNNGTWDFGEPKLPNWEITLSSYQNNYTGQGGSGNSLTLLTTVRTDQNGSYCFTNIRQGNYRVGEIQQNGWTQTEPSKFAHEINIKPGQKIEGLNFGNKVDINLRVGSICGIKFNDKNANGQQDPGELGIPGWSISIVGLVDRTVVTDKEGKFCFDNLPPGEYKVGEEFRSLWRQTKPSTNFYIIQLASGQNITDLQFGNTQDDKVQLGSICGTKFNDKNRDGRKGDGELGIAKWTIYLEGPMNLAAITDENGNFCFYGLIPGTYTVREKNETGWRQTKPSSITYTLEVGNGTNLTGIDFGNAQDPTVTLGSICGFKFNDLNGDGIKQDNEPVIPNWTIVLSGTMNLTTRTDARGKFCFDNLTFGRYTLSEEHKDKWKQTAPSTGSFTIELSEDNSRPDTFYFGNKEDIAIRNGSICGMKYLDKNGDGKKDLTEPGIDDWQINISGPVDRSIKTNREGKYCFENLPPGTYIIKEEPRADWVQKEPTSPNFYTVVLTSGQNLDGYYFGNKYEPKPGCVNPPSGMVAWWHLDFTARDARQDIAGYNNFGNMVNGPLQVAGKVLGALQFDGIDDYVEVADHSELNFGTGDFSFDAWIKTDAKTGVKVLVDKRKSYNRGYSFFLNDGYLSLQLADGSGFFGYTNYASPVFVADGNWHHIAVTVSRKSRQGILFYLDGVSTQFGDPTTHPATLTNTDNLRIGKNSSAGSNDPIGTFKGILDEIELFNRVLTQAEIVSIFNAGSAGKCKPSSQGGSVSGSVWHDLNNNGVKDPGEVSLTQWPVLLNGASVFQTETDNNGDFHFTDLKPGTYTLTAIALNGWSVVKPSKGTITFDMAQELTIDKLDFGLINDPCLTGSKNWHQLGNGVDGTVNALAVMDNDIYVGGTFSTASGVTGTNHIAKWNGTSWSALGSGLNGPVSSLLVVGNELYVGGTFTLAGNVSVNNIAKWNGTSWSALGSGTNSSVVALVEMNGNIYAGGLFTSAGGISANRIAKWNGTSWSALGSGTNSYVAALAVMNGNLYAGGYFSTAGGVSVNLIAKWDGSSWSSLQTGITSNSSAVFTLRSNGNQLFVGGGFNSAGTVLAKNIAIWDGLNWSPLGSGSDLSVKALNVINNVVYAGGNFYHAGGLSASRIAKWDGTNWSALGSGVSGNSGGSVNAIANIGSEIFAGGSFSAAGNSSANNIAKFSCTGTLTSIDDGVSDNELPKQFQLSQNYPNPFNPTTTIKYNLPNAGLVKITIYDILGREVRVLVNEEKNPGVYEVKFDAKNLASGVYIYTVKANSFFSSKKMLLTK